MKKIILIVVILIVIGIFILVHILNTSNGLSNELSKSELEQKGYNIFGYDYCTTDHSMEYGGDALTEWKCKLCGVSAINPDTNIPELCEKCSRITGRCNICGKLEK